MVSITPETTIVLITGANQGIGYETAKKLVNDHPGYHIILSGRQPDAVDAAAATLQEVGHSVSSLVMDVTSDESIRAAHQLVQDRFGRLDVLINNSAISDIAPDASLPFRARFQAVFDTNVIGAAVVTDTFIPLLERSSTTKRVIFVSSTIGSLTTRADASLGYPVRKHPYPQYACSKAALNMLALHYATQYEEDPSWKFNVADPKYYCATSLNNFSGYAEANQGALATCRLVEMGADAQSGTFQDDQGTVPW